MLHITSKRGQTGPPEQAYMYNIINTIYNKILDPNWFSVNLFVTQSVRNHVGVITGIQFELWMYL